MITYSSKTGVKWVLGIPMAIFLSGLNMFKTLEDLLAAHREPQPGAPHAGFEGVLRAARLPGRAEALRRGRHGRRGALCVPPGASDGALRGLGALRAGATGAAHRGAQEALGEVRGLHGGGAEGPGQVAEAAAGEPLSLQGQRK